MTDWLIDWKTSIDDVEKQGFLVIDIPNTLRIDHIKNENIPTDGQKENVKQFKMDIDSRWKRKENFTQEIHWILSLTQEYDDHLSLTSIRWTNEEVIDVLNMLVLSLSFCRPVLPSRSDGKMMNISMRVQSSQ